MMDQNITPRAKRKLLSSMVLSFASLTLVSCASYEGINQTNPNFGAATAHNLALQEVKPTDAQKNNTYIPADANRQAIARENYRNNTVTEPATVSTR